MNCYLEHEDLAVVLLQNHTVEETIAIMQQCMKTSEAVCALVRVGIPLQETAWAQHIPESQ